MAQGPRLGALTSLYVCAWPLSTGPCGHAHWPGRGLGVRPDSVSMALGKVLSLSLPQFPPL